MGQNRGSLSKRLLEGIFVGIGIGLGLTLLQFAVFATTQLTFLLQ